MIQFITKNIDWYKKIRLNPFWGKFIFFDLRFLSHISSEELFSKATTQIRLKNGTYKTSRPDRFKDIDASFIELLDSRKKYILHDIAVSDGVTSIELLEKFKKANIDSIFELSDKYSVIFFQNKWYGQIYYDADGYVLFSDIFNIYANRHASKLVVISWLLGLMLPKKIRIKKGDNEIILQNPITKKAITSGKVFFKHLDLINDNFEKNKYDITRCMNILQKEVFAEADIKLGIKNIISSTKDEGYIIFGRTNEKTGINHVSFFKKKEHALTHLLDINNGSELKPLLQKYQF